MAGICTLSFGAIIVGGGGAGMRAALQLARGGHKTAVVTKVFPTRSHTVSAQGNITCAIASADPNDDWYQYMHDTVKGFDYISDQDAIEYMCSVSLEVIFKLEHMGLPFSHTEAGRIHRRPFGGQPKDSNKDGQAVHTCAAADRTGHALLHTLYQASLKNGTSFLSEWYAVDLVKSQGDAVTGIITICIEAGETVYIRSKAVVLVTGGTGCIYISITNALINTDDGVGMTLRAGASVQDIEMWQFHPADITDAGVLVTEGCRDEGGYLINARGECFMEHYVPDAEDLAGRNATARSTVKEILAGNDVSPNKDHVLLKLGHLGGEVLHSRLSGICEPFGILAYVNPVITPIPVVPTCHYMMGGIATGTHGQAITQDTNGNDQIVEGLFAMGEAVCISIHDANRLDGNSLLDPMVFGHATSLHLEKALKEGIDARGAPESGLEASFKHLNDVNEHTSGEEVAPLERELQNCMQNYFGVFHTGKYMRKGIARLTNLHERTANVRINDRNQAFNTVHIEVLELQSLFGMVEVTTIAAEHRKEPRDAHTRKDFEEHDDENWLYHILYFPGEKCVSKRSVNFVPRTVPIFEPKVRTYQGCSPCRK